MTLRLLLALGLVAAPPNAATAQQYRSTLTRQLDAFAEHMAASGYTLESQALHAHTLTGVLPKGGSVGLILILTAGRTYSVLGVCDADCEDLDLALYPPEDLDTVLVEDREDDDVPIVEWSPAETGEVLLYVTMPKCSTEICYFGVRVLVKASDGNH